VPDQAKRADPLAWPVRLTGYGLVLREWEDDDLPAMVELFDEPDVAEYTNVPSPFDPVDYLAMIRRTRAEDNRLHLAITIDGRTPLGLAYFGPVRGELGYITGKAYRGRQLARRATRVLTDFGHGVLGLDRLMLQIMVGNVRSQAVALAVGYRRTDKELVRVQDKGRTKLLETWVHELTPEVEAL
jgi:RimJ/RimL family protein N-acetyltransferase